MSEHAVNIPKARAPQQRQARGSAGTVFILARDDGGHDVLLVTSGVFNGAHTCGYRASGPFPDRGEALDFAREMACWEGAALRADVISARSWRRVHLISNPWS